jgi:hypothetical protein
MELIKDRAGIGNEQVTKRAFKSRRKQVSDLSECVCE